MPAAIMQHMPTEGTHTAPGSRSHLRFDVPGEQQQHEAVRH